jgi:hypothetical protein
MTTLTSEDWRAILRATAEDVNARLADGTLKPPLRILITGGDDGNALEGTRFPVTSTVTDSKGEDVARVFSEEVVGNLRKKVL